MITQIINRVIGGADALHMIMPHQPTCTELGLLELLITLIIDFTGCFRTELFGNTESRFQLKMTPMIQWITESIGHCLGPFLKLFPIISILSGAVFLINSIRAHGTPLVMITSQPQLRDATELMIIGNHLRNQMTMIVDNRHFSRMIVIEFLRGGRLQEEILIHKLFHK